MSKVLLQNLFDEQEKERIYPTHLVDLENIKIIKFDKQEYSILSYTWNNDNNIDWDIKYLDSTRLVKSMTKLAFNILRKKLLLTYKIRYLWIDAFCINQNDIEDIKKQLPLTIYYYMNAKNTIACPQIATDLKSEPVNCFKNWLSRAWVIPEIIVSKNLCVLLWNDEKISEIFIKDHNINQENIYVYEDYIKEILLISRDIWKKGISLNDLIYLMYMKRATYSGDKVYSIFPLLKYKSDSIKGREWKDSWIFLANIMKNSVSNILTIPLKTDNNISWIPKEGNIDIPSLPIDLLFYNPFDDDIIEEQPLENLLKKMYVKVKSKLDNHNNIIIYPKIIINNVIIIKERYKSYDIKIKEYIINTEGVLNDNLESNINVTLIYMGIMIEHFKIKNIKNLESTDYTETIKSKIWLVIHNNCKIGVIWTNKITKKYYNYRKRTQYIIIK